MKKLSAFILLLCHMNTSMFLPQIAEEDVFDSKGNQVDDINTVCEYIDEVILGNTDATPEDEDDDSGQNFVTVNALNYFYQQPSFLIETIVEVNSDNPTYSIYLNTKLSSTISDVITPPPEA